MTTWRDAASDEAQDDLDALLGSALELAKRQLDKRREIYPYALVIDTAGTQRMLAADTGAERPESSDLITTLLGAVVEQRAQLRAAAIVADVLLPETGSDALRVSLEHSEGVALTVLLPYQSRSLRKDVHYGALQAGAAAPFIWPGDLPKRR